MLQPGVILAIIAAYFGLLILVSRLTSRRSGAHTYFDGNRESPWFLVAFGMIGSGISAVSLVSIPGNVGNEHLYYFQFILGTLVGYLFIAFVLMPVYYKLRVVSIYSYLEQRFGHITFRTGSLFFIVSQSFGAALRLLLSVKILQTAFFDQWQIPYQLSIAVVLLMIWLYTRKSGVKTIVWTDALQSAFLITVIVLSIQAIRSGLGLSLSELWHTVRNDPHARVFDWNASSPTHFGKQFIAGILITVALVGLDQSMMQKSLTISNRKDAQKNVLSFSFFIALAQTLFLVLGILLYLFAAKKGLALPMENGHYTEPDRLYPELAMHYLGQAGTIAFFIGVVASTFATIDSCITALTTSISYDWFRFPTREAGQQKSIKRWALLGVNALIFGIVWALWNSKGAIITTIFTIAGYTYGPLLGLYLAGLFTRVQLKDKWVPAACLSAPLLTYLLSVYLKREYAYDFGFMNIGVNAAITIVFLLLLKKKKHE